MIESKGKTCNKCGTFRTLEDGFHKAKGMADGYENRCKSCEKNRVSKSQKSKSFMRN